MTLQKLLSFLRIRVPQLTLPRATKLSLPAAIRWGLRIVEPDTTPVVGAAAAAARAPKGRKKTRAERHISMSELVFPGGAVHSVMTNTFLVTRRNRDSKWEPRNAEAAGMKEGVESREEGEKEERRPKKKVAVLIGYCGTGYRGMQLNPPQKSIEGDLFEAFIQAGAISKANSDDPKKVSSSHFYIISGIGVLLICKVIACSMCTYR